MDEITLKTPVLLVGCHLDSAIQNSRDDERVYFMDVGFERCWSDVVREQRLIKYLADRWSSSAPDVFLASYPDKTTGMLRVMDCVLGVDIAR